MAVNHDSLSAATSKLLPFGVGRVGSLSKSNIGGCEKSRNTTMLHMGSKFKFNTAFGIVLVDIKTDRNRSGMLALSRNAALLP